MNSKAPPGPTKVTQLPMWTQSEALGLPIAPNELPAASDMALDADRGTNARREKSQRLPSSREPKPWEAPAPTSRSHTHTLSTALRTACRAVLPPSGQVEGTLAESNVETQGQCLCHPALLSGSYLMVFLPTHPLGAITQMPSIKAPRPSEANPPKHHP